MSHERQKAAERDVPADPAVILVGIDPALDKHGVVAMRTATCARLARCEIPNSIAGMQGLEKRLAEWREQAGGRRVIGIEEATAYGEAVVCYWAQAGFPVVVVSALKVARFREAIRVDANDFTDAEAVTHPLMVQPDLGQAPVHETIENDAHGSTARRLRQRSRRHARWTWEQTALLQVALNAPRYHGISAAYLERQHARGHVGGAARLRLARRLSDLIYAMLRENRPYDAADYLEKKQQAA